MRARFKIAAVAAAATLAAGLTTIPASAGSLGTYNGSGIRIRSTPHTSGGTIYGLGYFGQHACTYSAVTGTVVHGDPYWDYNKDLTTGVHTGYSSDYYMYPFYYGKSC